jgi:peptidyl-prolyl cis-trans isomerase SurA
LIRNKIIAKKITFAEAARTESDKKETRANGGSLINPKTQDTRFELTKWIQVLQSSFKLEDDAISQPILDTDENGKKSYKLITVTNRINEHIADYATDYIKIKELALKEKQIKAIRKWFDETIKTRMLKYL